MRVIDADALKETIAKNVYVLSDAFNSRDYGMFWTGGIEKAIDEQPTAQQWIPCSEVLPSENGYYLVTYRWIGTYSCEAYLEIGIDEWRKGEWVEKPTAWEVLAWMPLPDPYTEEENERT